MTSAVQSLNSVTLCNPMDCNTPGFPVLHYLLKFAQTHVRWIGNAIQPSHPVIPSPPAFNLSQYQGFFKWVSSSHKVAKVLRASASTSVFPMNIQGWFPLGLTGLISLLSKIFSRVSPSTTVQKHQFFRAQPSLWSNSHIHICCCCCSVASVVSNSVRSHRRQPTRLPHPWDSPGKNTGVGCHFLLQCMKVKRESEVAQSCPTLSDPMDCSPPGSSVNGIFQARVLEWGAMAFSDPYMTTEKNHSFD